MESNLCDISHLDTDVLLPPRKRLLAGLKKQNCDGTNSHMPSTSTASIEINTRLGNLLRSRLGNPNLTLEEMVESARSAAEAAAKVAEAARAAAEEKASKAAQAVAAAKTALEMVATVSEETASKESYSKKSKMKKHVPVQMLYHNNDNNNHQGGVENLNTDEELAQKLHRAINSSPRISKTPLNSESKNHKHKRQKSVVSNGGVLLHSIINHNGIMAGDVDSEGSEKSSKFNMGNGEAEINHSEKLEDSLDNDHDTGGIGRKRGRMKQKKLPLSICNFRDQANPKEDMKSSTSSLIEETRRKADVGNNKTSQWKCKAFKTPACVKQNKVMQS